MKRALKYSGIFILIAIISSLLFFFYDIRKLKHAVLAGSSLIESPYGKLEYVVIGEGSPVLISHGALGGYDQGILLARAFLPDDYTLIIPSRFGYLQSALPEDPSYASQADAYAFLLDSLGIKKVTLVGVSAGGPAALEFAIRHPDRADRLVLISSAAYPPPTDEARLEFQLPTFVYDILYTDYVFWSLTKIARPLLDYSFGVTSQKNKEAGAANDLIIVEKILDAMLPISLRNSGRIADANNLDPLKPAPLQRIKAPTLILHAEDDQVPYTRIEWIRYTAGEIPDAKFVSFPTGGHMILENMGSVRKEIESFLGYPRK
jgi:pimeloyl-ACP methyl ester carboxylesterase